METVCRMSRVSWQGDFVTAVDQPCASILLANYLCGIFLVIHSDGTYIVISEGNTYTNTRRWPAVVLM